MKEEAVELATKEKITVRKQVWQQCFVKLFSQKKPHMKIVAFRVKTIILKFGKNNDVCVLKTRLTLRKV